MRDFARIFRLNKKKIVSFINFVSTFAGKFFFYKIKTKKWIRTNTHDICKISLLWLHWLSSWLKFVKKIANNNISESLKHLTTFFWDFLMGRKILFNNFYDKHENKPNLYTAWSVVYHFALSVFYFIRTKDDEKNRHLLTIFVLE